MRTKEAGPSRDENALSCRFHIKCPTMIDKQETEAENESRR